MKSTFLASATWRKVRSTYSCRSDRRSSLTSTITVPDSIFDRSRMSLISVSRSLPDEWIVLANSTCLGVRLPSGFFDSWSDRISRLFSGVRSSCDMLARNSDLYLEVSASCLAFSSRAWRACSTSWFLRSTSWFWCASRRAFSCSSSLVCCSSCWRLCSSCASDCDCFSRSSVRMLASIVLITMPIDSVSWSRKAWCVGLKRSNEASSTTPRTWPSKMIGSTRTFSGATCVQARRDLQAVGDGRSQQDLLLVIGALADQALAQLDFLAVGAVAVRGVAGHQAQLGQLVRVAQHVELGLLRAHHRRQLGQDQVAHRHQVLLALQHAARTWPGWS